MGAVCSGGTKKRSVEVGKKEKDDNSSGFSGKLRAAQIIGKKNENNSRPLTNNGNGDEYRKTTTHRHNHSGEMLSYFSRELKPSKPANTGDAGKVSQKKSFLGKAGTVSLEKAVDVLDTIGSSMSNLNARSGFISGLAPRGNRIYILAFEVANTIAKGATLFQSLSEENVKFLKQDILNSEGVRQLVSTDMTELLIIAAADKREELDVFSKEVVRFGDLCKDPQWHNLGRYFSKSDSESSTDKQCRKEAEMTMQELTTLAQHTSELYHEFNALDRFDQDYQRKIEELESLNLPQKGESLMILHSELKQQKKLVNSLKKKSLWSKNLEEIMEKLVDIVTYLQQAILEAFGNNGVASVNRAPGKNPQSLGAAGLSLHYATMINQIDNIASRPASLPPNTRDNLYHSLPESVKAALRTRLHSSDSKEGLTVAQVKAEMEKTLQWLVPVAANTTKAHQGFGWVGEWANTGIEFGKHTASNNSLIRLQTLYHANRQKIDQYILELVTWLHHLISLVRHRDHGLKAVPARSPTRKGLAFHARMLSLGHSNKGDNIQLSQEDREMLDKVRRRRLVPGISKSQEFFVAKKKGKIWALSKSTRASPLRESTTRHNLKHRNANMLDVMDGLDFIA